jgi:hypothetical protein
VCEDDGSCCLFSELSGELLGSRARHCDAHLKIRHPGFLNTGSLPHSYKQHLCNLMILSLSLFGRLELQAGRKEACRLFWTW